MIKIALDVMGGDNAPLSNLVGACDFLENQSNDVKIIFVGDESIIKSYFQKRKNFTLKNFEIVNSTQILSSEDRPSRVHKDKPYSSMILSLNLLKDKKVDAVVSAGNTGHLLGSSFFILGTIESIKRPALIALIPSINGNFLICDVGANTAAKPEHILQYGQMASVYLKHHTPSVEPKIALLNIGQEHNKGNELTKSAYSLLKDNLDNFIGNIESRYLFNGKANIILTDGFTGNTVLKLIEGMTNYNLKLFKEKLDLNDSSKIKDIQRLYDYEEYGATPILGINGLVLKSHGSSSGISIKNGLKNALKLHKNKTIQNLKKL